MKLLGKEADDFEAACRDGHRVAWFGSVEVRGGGEEVVIGIGRWWNGNELELAAEAQGTMFGREYEEPRWFGSKVLEEPGQ